MAEDGKITVLVRQPEGPPRRYRRAFLGLTLRAALKQLQEESGETGSFPDHAGTVLVNGYKVNTWDTGRVFNAGDILSVERTA